MQDNLNDKASRVDAIIERIGRQPDMLVPVLQAAQEEFKYLSKDVMALIAKGLNVPAAKVYGVATFYAHFTLEPKGKHIIRCCDGTACHVKGSTAIMDALCRSRACRKPTHHKRWQFHARNRLVPWRLWTRARRRSRRTRSRSVQF